MGAVINERRTDFCTQQKELHAHFCNSVYNVEAETPIKDEREKPKVTTETIENTKSVTETLRKDESEKSESIGDLKQDKKRAKQPRVRNKSKKNLSKPPEKDNLRESSEDKKQKESKEVKEKEETGGSEMEIQPTETRKRKRKRRSHKKEAKKMNLGNSPTEQVGCTKPKQEFKCEQCKKRFHKRKHLNNHRYIYHNAVRIECKTCGKVFSTEARRERHKSVHEGHKCPYCDLRYMKISDLNTHVAVDHVALVSCPECGHTFRHKHLLRKHRKIHAPDAKRLACPHEGCPRSYTLKRNLDAHIRSFHLGQRYPCTVSDCTFILSTKQKLDAHVLLHSLERVQPHFIRGPRDDVGLEQRKLRLAEEERLRLEALRERHRTAVSWWEGSSVNEDSDLGSDSSLTKFLKADQPAAAAESKKTPRKKKRKRRRSRSKHRVDLDETTDVTTTGVDSDVSEPVVRGTAVSDAV